MLRGPYTARRRAARLITELSGGRESYISRLIGTLGTPILTIALCPSSVTWHGPKFQVLRVETFRFSSSKVSIYEFPFLPEPTTGAVCREGGPETEFATAGT